MIRTMYKNHCQIISYTDNALKKGENRWISFTYSDKAIWQYMRIIQ